MSKKEIIIVFDLGPGDGGKGGVVHKLAQKAHTIIKVGGAQGSHGVSTARKQKFAFSQWGCGTFEGVKTHITPLMVASPEGMLNEADGLRYSGVTNAFDLLTVDERAICSTPYHGISSRIREIARGTNPRGTIGTGVGEAFRDSIKYPELVIRAGDLGSDLRAKLEEIRIYQMEALKHLVAETAFFLQDDLEIVEKEMTLLEDPGFLDHNVERFREVGRLLNVVDPDYMGHEIFNDGLAVVESSHGILTDNVFGFQPHVSAIRTLPEFTENMLLDAGFDGEITKLGVHRAYTIRHGAGPMPTADPKMNDDLLPGSCKEENRYQGKIRVGPLDFVLLRYAVEVCGGPEAIDGLAISWFDQISKNGAWQVCDRYNTSSDKFPSTADYVDSDGRIKVREWLCNALPSCEPEITSIGLPDSIEEQYRLCDTVMREKLGIPVHLVSFGPTEQDKLMKEEIYDRQEA